MTVRLGEDRQKALLAAARRRRVSASVVIREALDRALTDAGTMAARAGHLRGTLQLSRKAPGAKRGVLQTRNWRP